jgi:hypothetical protein
MNLLSKLPHDKAQHIIGGLLIFYAVAFLTSPLIGLGVSCVVGILKEVIYDKIMGKGHPDAWDAVATAGGAVLGLLCAFL